MKVRGRRRCTECANRWSYFETGTVACPECGSLRSVAVEDDPALHTETPAEIDLTPARSMLGARPLGEVAEAARSVARGYVRSRGFVDGGELLELDEEAVAAAELSYASDHVRRALEVDESTEAYFLEILAGADAGSRPEAVPSSVHASRGLAVVETVGAYRRDVTSWLEEHPDPTVRPVLDQLRSHEKRIAALDGDVPPEEADALVTAARSLGRYLRQGDESALARAEDHLSDLD